MNQTETDLQEAVEDLGQSDLAPERPGPDAHWQPRIVAAVGFEDGQRVRVTQPNGDMGETCPHCKRPYDDEGGTCGDEAAREIREHALRNVLQFLASENDLKRIGWRCALTHWLVFQGETQQEMADRLGVSKGAISQSLNALRHQIALYLQGNGAP